MEEFLLGQNGGDNAQTFGAISLIQYGGHLLSDTASDQSSMLGVEDSQSVGEKDEVSPLNNQFKNLDLHKMAEINLLMEENGNDEKKDIFSGLVNFHIKIIFITNWFFDLLLKTVLFFRVWII